MRDLLLRPSVLVPLVVLAALAVLPAVAAAVEQPFYVAFFARIIIYAIAASALNLALGYGGLVSFGHALFLGLGAYSVALPAHLGIENGFAHLAVCIVVTGLVGFVTGVISLRTSGIAFIMITLAFAQMGYFLFVSLKQFGGDDGLPIAQTSRFPGLDLGSPYTVYFTSLVVLILVFWWLARLRVAPFGMALRGARQNPRRVNAIGLPVLGYQLTAYVISAVLTGIAGLLLANLNAFGSPSSLFWTVSGELIVMVVLGGMGSVAGPLLGAIAYLGLEEILKSFTEHWMAIFGPLIVLVALAGKAGIVGLLERLDRRTPGAGAAARDEPVPALAPAGEQK
jgi:branched-chain amino acid transport system permease protein